MCFKTFHPSYIHTKLFAEEREREREREREIMRERKREGAEKKRRIKSGI